MVTTSPLTWTLLLLIHVFAIGLASAKGVKGVFAQYMVGELSSLSQAKSDISLAQKMGLDAFALNIQQPDAYWTTSALQLLFTAASTTSFKLFLCMDMAAINTPIHFVPLFQTYSSHPSYYTYFNRPFLSTFRGAASTTPQTWNSLLTSLTTNGNPRPYFIPNFDDWHNPNAYSSTHTFTPDFFTTFAKTIDGVMAWETAWPFSGQSISASNKQDSLNFACATAAKKTYMLPISTFQFKHLDPWNNWYRIGGLTLPQKMQFALKLQPDFVQLLTWNDAGEGHYIGNLWSESYGSDTRLRELTKGYDHRAWGDIIGPFVRALKSGGREVYPDNGREWTGMFWYRALLVGADCSRDRYGLGKPSGWREAGDAVNVGVLVGRDVKKGEVKVRVGSGGKVLEEFEARAGMNMWHVEGVKGGKQVVEIVKRGKVVGRGVGGMDVTGSIAGTGGICNYNYLAVRVQ